MNIDEKLQKALDALALSAAQLNESAIHLRCLFADANRKGSVFFDLSEFDGGKLPLSEPGSCVADPNQSARANCQKYPKYTGPVQPSEVHSVLASLGFPVDDLHWFMLVRNVLELCYRERGLL